MAGAGVSDGAGVGLIVRPGVAVAPGEASGGVVSGMVSLRPHEMRKATVATAPTVLRHLSLSMTGFISRDPRASRP